MSSSLIEIGDAERKYTSTGRHSGYLIAMYHTGLDETRHLSASDISILEGKVNNQAKVWTKKWDRQVEIQDKKDKEERAQALSAKSKVDLEAVEQLLAHTLNIDDAVDWGTLKNTETFAGSRKNHPKLAKLPEEPVRALFLTKVPFFKALFGGKEKHVRQQEEKYQQAMSEWRAIQEEWASEKLAYEKKQAQQNTKVDELETRYKEKNEEAVLEYCEMVLNNSVYPDSFPKDFELQYANSSGMLLIDIQLPGRDNIPTRTLVKYVKSRDEFEEKHLGQAAQDKLFDSAVYQIALRTLHELFEADVVDAITSITLNGIVSAVNSATGHRETKCILSIQAAKLEFMNINLESVDPKACFKALKGVGSAKLSSITPVRPILELDKSDRRFRSHYEVANDLDESTNLAAMDWEDFEHLIREIFEKEFAQNGGEVKVTQASSDGGVDAVAFDPDPIRGGKIVIQAKRYTNTVGVAAVRDLYGTVMNEGATKGILVTTADYGADSYEFANGKPLTLLNGSNLLHLLDKHGHKAKIDIREAKLLLSEG